MPYADLLDLYKAWQKRKQEEYEQAEKERAEQERLQREYEDKYRSQVPEPTNYGNYGF